MEYKQLPDEKGVDDSDKVLCGLCGGIIWNGAVPASDGDGGKSDDTFYHSSCAEDLESKYELAAKGD